MFHHAKNTSRSFGELFGRAIQPGSTQYSRSPSHHTGSTPGVTSPLTISEVPPSLKWSVTSQNFKSPPNCMPHKSKAEFQIPLDSFQDSTISECIHHDATNCISNPQNTISNPQKAISNPQNIHFIELRI